MRRRVGIALCALLLCGLVLPAAGNAKSSRHISAKTSNLPAAATSAISAAMGRDQQAYHAAVVRKGYQMKNPRSGLQATFTRQGVRVESGKASWGMALAAFGASGKLRRVPRAKPQANQNRVEYRRGALTEWYVNGPAGLEQGFTIAKAPAGSANGTLELALRLTGNLTASVDAAKTGLVLKGEQAELRYTGLAARDAKGRKLRSWLEVQNGRLLVQVAAARATYPLVVDPYIQVAKLTADDAPGDELGTSVAMSADGSTAVAGAPVYIGSSGISNPPPGPGAVYVFVNPSGGWAGVTPAAKLTASDGAARDQLGWSVSVSADGSTVVAGAPNAPYDSTTSKPGPGAVYVFVKPTGGWANGTQAAKLVASDGVSGDHVGRSVSVSADGSTVVAGTPIVNSQQGAAYVFTKSGSGWTQAARLTASDGQPKDNLGFSVSVSADGSTVAAGATVAPYNSTTSTPGPGAVYVFVKPTGGWLNGTQAARLAASDGQALDLLGWSVSVSADGSTVVAGAPQTPTAKMGAAYVFVEPTGGWADGTQAARLAASVPSQAYSAEVGKSVSVSADGSTVAAGAPGVYPQGAAYVFVKPSGGWADGTEAAELPASLANSDGNAEVGASVSMSADGSTVAAGAPQDDPVFNVYSGLGAEFVFSDAVPFDSFDASRLEITLGPPSSFQMNASFILGSGNDGIDPLTEPVTLIVGNLVMAIPAGSFQQQNNGNYAFSGVVEGVSLNVVIKDKGGNQYSFKVEGSSPNALSITNPVTVTLSIGNDTGAWTGAVPIN